MISSDEGGPTPPWLFAGGGVGSTKGGKTATVTQVLQPSTYYVFDLGEGEGDNVPSFADQGATATIEVTGEAGDAELPVADATVTAEDYRFATDGLVAGVNRIRFDNTGEELHHVIAIPYQAGATLEQVKAFATSDAPPEGPPPVDFSRASVTAVLEGGDSQIAELNLIAGTYAFICFISDRAGGPPHAALGMIDEVVVRQHRARRARGDPARSREARRDASAPLDPQRREPLIACSRSRQRCLARAQPPRLRLDSRRP